MFVIEAYDSAGVVVDGPYRGSKTRCLDLLIGFAGGDGVEYAVIKDNKGHERYRLYDRDR